MSSILSKLLLFCIGMLALAALIYMVLSRLAALITIAIICAPVILLALHNLKKSTKANPAPSGKPKYNL